MGRSRCCDLPSNVTLRTRTCVCDVSALESMTAIQSHTASASAHWSTQEGALQTGLADCYEQGLVKAVGVSNYGPKQLRKVHAALLERGVPLASAQVG